MKQEGLRTTKERAPHIFSGDPNAKNARDQEQHNALVFNNSEDKYHDEQMHDPVDLLEK